MTPFGRDVETWERLTDAGRAFLIERARLRRVTTYTELNTVLTNRAGLPGFDVALDTSARPWATCSGSSSDATSRPPSSCSPRWSTTSTPTMPVPVSANLPPTIAPSSVSLCYEQMGVLDHPPGAWSRSLLPPTTDLTAEQLAGAINRRPGHHRELGRFPLG